MSPKSMKILLISGIYGSEIGGPAFYTQNLARSLINSGHSVTIVTLKHSKEHPQYVDWPVFYVDRNQQLMLRFIKVFKLIYRLGKTSDFIFANGLYHECGLALRVMKTKSIAEKAKSGGGDAIGVIKKIVAEMPPMVMQTAEEKLKSNPLNVRVDVNEIAAR